MIKVKVLPVNTRHWNKMMVLRKPSFIIVLATNLTKYKKGVKYYFFEQSLFNVMKYIYSERWKTGTVCETISRNHQLRTAPNSFFGWFLVVFCQANLSIKSFIRQHLAVFDLENMGQLIIEKDCYLPRFSVSVIGRPNRGIALPIDTIEKCC